MQKVFVTGAGGFIGRNLVKKLESQGFQVWRSDVELPDQNSRDLVGNLLDIDLESLLLKIKPDAVVHLAAQVDVMSSIKDPIKDLELNALLTLKLILASTNSGCQNFCYIHSGGAVYDSKSDLPFSESSPEKIVSPYGLTKKIGEEYVRIFSTLQNSNWTSLALSNCYGKLSDNQKGVIYQFFHDISNGVQSTINGPDVTRDFVYISDVVDSILSAIRKPTNSRVNISSNTEISLIDLYKKIARLCDSKLEPVILHRRFGDVERSRLDNSRAAKLLGWVPLVTIDEGLRLISLEREAFNE